MSTIVGIYLISNIVDDRVYVGSAVNYRRRKNEHKSDLLNNKHHNTHLQRFVNKYGFDSLKFDLIESCSLKDLLVREEYWMSQYLNKFNIATSPSAPMLGRTHSQEYRTRRSLMMTGTGNTNYGIAHTEIVKKIISNKNKGRKMPNSEIERRKLTKTKSKNIQILKDDTKKTFISIAETAKFLGVAHQSVSKALKNNRPCKAFTITEI